MLQDGIFVRGDWIKDKANQAIAVKFLQASFKGWAYCRDHFKECVNIVRQPGHGAPEGPPDLADERGQQADLAEQDRRHRHHERGRVQAHGRTIAYKFKVIKKPATSAAYRTDLSKKAVAALKAQGVDVTGKGYKPAVVKLKEGGK